MFCLHGGKGNDADPEMFGQSVDRTGMGRQRDTGGQKEEESARGRRRSGRFGSGLDSGKSEQAIDFKHEMYELGLTLEKLAREEGVQIRLNTEVTPEYAEKEQADALIIAVGSRPIVPPLPGIDGDHVVIVNNYYLEKDKVKGGEVVVLGGGLAGCECAIHLAREGRKVHLVETLLDSAPVVKQIGDCIRPANICMAVYQGYHAALDI